MPTDSITITDDALSAALAKIPKLVDAGEAWLPTLDPDWFNTVSPTDLAMDSNTRCVLGQIAIAKGYKGETAPFDLLRETGTGNGNGWGDGRFEVLHGFTAPLLVNQGVYFEALRREWVGRLEARRAAA